MLAEALGDLALTQSVRGVVDNGLDAVEEQRIMVVLERAWSVGLRTGRIDGDVDGDKVDESRDDAHDQDVDVTIMCVDDGQEEHQPPILQNPEGSLLSSQGHLTLVVGSQRPRSLRIAFFAIRVRITHLTGIRRVVHGCMR
jgi:hypothetical protein